MPIENISEIEQSLGIEAGKLTEMISSEDKHTVDLSKRIFKSKSDYDTLIENTKRDSGIAAVEIAVKKVRKDMGLEFEGKTMDNLLKSYKSKVEIEAKIDPNKKFDTLQIDFDKRGVIIEALEGKFNTLETSVKQERQVRDIDSKLLSEIPDNTIIPKKDVLAILKTKNKFNIGENGFEIIGTDGNPMKNAANMNLLTPKEFMAEAIKPYLKKVEGGAGDGDGDGTHTEGSFEAFEKEMESKGIKGEALAEEMQKRIKDKTLKL